MSFDPFTLPLYDLNETPNEESGIIEWRYPPMYKRDAKGVQREWFGYIHNGGIVTSHGTLDGVKTISVPAKVELNTSGRSFIEQAALELRARYEVKNRKEGYRFKGEITQHNIGPMLAEDWHKRRASTKLYFPVVIQPKLDGIRCLVKEDSTSGKIMYRTRTNKYLNFGYLFDEEISAMLPFFPFEIEFDGELYIHGRKLQSIASVVGLKKTREEVEKIKGKKREEYLRTLDIRDKELQYNIFTIITAKEMPYEERNDLLFKAYQLGQESLGRSFTKVVLVPDHVVENMEEINELLDSYTKEGYEGVMIYKIGASLPEDKVKEAYYRSGRSYNLIKYKPFFDEEMKIIAVKGGKGKAEDLAGARVIDEFGVTHEVNIAEDDDVRRRIFNDPSLVLGKMATVKHYGRTEDGKLRHANIICIRDYE